MKCIITQLFLISKRDSFLKNNKNIRDVIIIHLLYLKYTGFLKIVQSGRRNWINYAINYTPDIHINDYRVIDWLVETNNVTLLKYLVERGTDIGSHLHQLLIMVIRNAHLDMLKYLWSFYPSIQGLYFTVSSNDVITCVSKGNLEFLKYLYPLVVVLPNYHIECMLKTASKYGYIEITKYIEEIKINPGVF